MGTSLNGLTPGATYQSLIKISDNSALSTTLKPISDGLGNDTPLYLSTSAIAFGASSNFYWDNVNSRLGIGTTAPSAYLEISAVWGSGNSRWLKLTSSAASNTFGIVPAQVGFSTAGYSFQLNDINQIVGDTGKTLFGTNLIGNEMTARVGIRGNGSTSATTSFLVQNSAGTAALTVTDDGSTFVANSLMKIWVSGGVIRFDQQGGAGFPITFWQNGQIYQYVDQGSLGIAFRNDYSIVMTTGNTSNINSSAKLQIDSTNRGFLPPRLSTTQKLAIASPAAGLQVYDSTLNQMSYYNGTTWVNF